MEINEITGDILDAAVKIHKLFGPGLFESVYERLLFIELEKRDHRVQRQVSVSFDYEGVRFDNAFRIDLLVDDEVVVELKSVAVMNPVFARQLKTYLVLTGKRVGLLVNFGMSMMKDGVERIVNSKLPDVTPVGKTPRLHLSDLDLSISDSQPTVIHHSGQQFLCGSASPRETISSPQTLCGSPRIAPASQLASLGGYSSPREIFSSQERQ